MPRPLRTDPDRELVLACQASLDQGFHGAFRELYEKYRDRVYNVCYRISGNATDALDASQETFGVVFRKIRDFRFESKFSSWVYRVAVNASIDHKRRTHSSFLTSLENLQSKPPGSRRVVEFRDEQTEAPMAAATRHELEHEVQQAMTHLSDKMHSITVLRHIEGLSYEEIAEVLGISLGTVKSRLSRAHAALERELSPVIDRHYLR